MPGICVLFFTFRKKCQNFVNTIISNISAHDFKEQAHGLCRTMNPLPQVMEVLIFSFSNSVYCLLKGLAKTQVWLSLWVQQIWVTQPVAKAFLEEVTINPTIQVPSRRPTNTEQLYQRNFHTVKKVLLPTTDFPTWGSGKETENPREFDFGGQWDLIIEFTQDWETDSCRAQTKPCVHQDPGERSSDPTRD